MTRRALRLSLLLAGAVALGTPAAWAVPGSAAIRAGSPSRAASTLERLEGIERADRVLLPALGGPVALRVHAIDSLVVIEAPKAVSLLARTLRLRPLSLCPDVDETTTGVVLRCRSRRIVATLDRTDAGYTLDVAETRGLPWSGEDGAPIVPFDVEAAAGGPCQGSSPLQRAECLLSRNDRAGAATILDAIQGAAADEGAALRRGDLAFARGEVLTATTLWTRARGRPWETLAAARLCELSWACLGSSRLEDLYPWRSVPEWAARDLLLRYARTTAFLGRAAAGADVLALHPLAVAACAPVAGLCRDVAGAALGDDGPRALDALALWISIPDPARSPGSYQATPAAATIAEREGAPTFAANLLASAAAEVPTRSLRDHLLRTAELYVAGGDLVRAGVIVEFARTRLGHGALTGARWAHVTQALRPTAALRGAAR